MKPLQLHTQRPKAVLDNIQLRPRRVHARLPSPAPIDHVRLRSPGRQPRDQILPSLYRRDSHLHECPTPNDPVLHTMLRHAEKRGRR